MPTPAAGAASPHCMTALVQHHLQGERGCEPSAALQGRAHTTALTSPATRTSQPSPPAAASPSPYPAWPPRRKEVEDCRALQGAQGVAGVGQGAPGLARSSGNQTGTAVCEVRTYLVLAVSACTRADALHDQGCQRAPSRQHSFRGRQQHGGEPERQGRVLQSRRLWGWFLGGTDRSAHPHRAERGPCGPTEAGMERGEREKIGKAEAKGTRRTHTHIDARGVEGAVVGGYGCAGIGRQCGAAAARHQAHPTAVDGEPDGQRQPHTARCGQQAVQQGHAQQGPVLPA